jgi:hypothetical protein
LQLDGRLPAEEEPMTGRTLTIALVAGLAAAAPAGALAQDRLEATLTGFEEVPAVSTPGSGRFSARIVGSGPQATIEYELSYSGLSSTTTVAHIHFSERHVTGAVSAFLCGGGDKPACPPEGTVNGTIDAADVVGPEARGLAPGELEEFVRALQAGATYVNVHSASFPDGEIRGQIGGADGTSKAGPQGGAQPGAPSGPQTGPGY